MMMMESRDRGNCKLVASSHAAKISQPQTTGQKNEQGQKYQGADEE
jgi:hypothetical protein